METMKQLFSIVLLLMVSMTMSAQEVVVSISDFTGGTVSVKDKKGQEVIINVAPADGYYINTEDVEVIAVKDPASLTRAEKEQAEQESLPAGVTLALTLVDDEGNPIVDEKSEFVTDPDDNTAARYYLFTVPEGLGAWVWKANFHEVNKPVTSGNLTEKVSWEVTSNETSTTLTLSGDGEAYLASKGPVTYPWKDFDDAITDIVVEEGIEAIGDGILDNCTALQSITLKGQKPVALGNNTLTKNVTVDVYGRLYNTYRDDAGWREATIASADSEPMTGVAFGASNSYDVFVTSTPLLVPFGLVAYTVAAIDGSNVKIDPIKDDIIPANVAVLLYSEKIDDDDFRTTPTDEKGETTSSQLVPVTDKDGLEVVLGGVYLLYNDVFYLSQAGTVPAGGIYLPVPEEKEEQAGEEGREEGKESFKARLYLTIDDDTTAIKSIYDSQIYDLRFGAGAWYDLSGRRLNGAPTTKGVYINNGKKLIIR